MRRAVATAVTRRCPGARRRARRWLRASAIWITVGFALGTQAQTPAVPSGPPAHAAAPAPASSPSAAPGAPADNTGIKDSGSGKGASAEGGKDSERYVDRVIDGSVAAQPVDVEEEELAAFDTSGWPRHLRIDARRTRESGTFGGRVDLSSILLFYAIDTPNLGSLTFEADSERDASPRAPLRLGGTVGVGQPLGQSFTARQRGLPWSDGVKVDNSAGNIGLPLPILSRSASRVAMPMARVAGAGTHWHVEPQGLRISAATGAPLQYEGSFASRVLRMPGEVSQGGIQVDRYTDPARPLAGGWSAAAQVGQARGVAPFGAYAAAWREASLPTIDSRVDARSVWLGLAAQQPYRHWQVQALETRIDSALSGATRLARGAWADTGTRDGRLRFSAGGYALERGLTWAGLPMANNLLGAYVRGTSQSRQWLFDSGVDVLRPLDGSGRTGYYATGSARGRVSGDLHWGAAASVRDYSGRGYTVGTDIQWRHLLGQTDLRMEWVDEALQRVERVSMMHAWVLDSDWNITTNITPGLLSRPGEGKKSTLAGSVSFDARLFSNASLRGTVGFEHIDQRRRNNVNLALSWPFARGWFVDAGVLHDRGRSAQPTSLDPLAAPNVLAPVPERSSGYSIALRYEARAGTSIAPIGGRPQDGAGSVEGVIYLDLNRNGQMDAGERGAADVSVAINSMHITKTDASGRFEFPWVSAGRFSIAVLDETLPLPWTSPDGGTQTIDVARRETTRLNIGVVKP
jgi:hypothetical protein